MPINIISEDAVNNQTAQILDAIINHNLHFKGNSGEEITVSMSNLHTTLISGIRISNERATLFDNVYWHELAARLNDYSAAISRLKQADPENADYESLLEEIHETVTDLNNGELNQSSLRLYSLGEYKQETKEILLYTGSISDLANATACDYDTLLAYVLIRASFSAYFGQSCRHSSIREIEDAMIECATLYYLSDAYAQTGFTLYNEVFETAKTILSKNSKHQPASRFGVYIFEKANEEKINKPERILGEYCQKANLIDCNSFNVIRYSVELIKGYPNSSSMPHEGERILYSLLIQLILNIGQRQELSFVSLFKDTKAELKKSLLEQWQPKGTCLDADYQSQLEHIIEDTVSSNILVENMSLWQGAAPLYKGGPDYTSVIDRNLLKFLPYKQQVECWNALLAPATTYKSMCVTTGTGSGKTESFMVPLITDLTQKTPEGLKAIFLYPLNALMEDQKEKLNDMIERSGSHLTFAVYNGSSPYWPDDGICERLSHEVVYREEIQGSMRWDATTGSCVNGGRIPDIILTNPTMLEYLLLKKSDENIIGRSLQSLSWMVIDETHTYCGAGADELAMLIRRVLKAFDRKAKDIHFATSSATVGNNDSDLLKFISGITGQEKDVIKIVKGQRSTPDFSLAKIPQNNCKEEIISKLNNNSYVYLNDLISYKDGVEEKLEELDRLCQGGLKIKAHFYIESLTNGLYANVEDILNGEQTFNLTAIIPFDRVSCKPDSRYVNMFHCLNCGAVLANCTIDNNKYSRTGSASIPYGQNIAIDSPRINPQPNAMPCDIATDNNIIQKSVRSAALLSPDQSCPCCGASQDDLRGFSTSVSSCFRSITPSLLKNASKHEGQHPYYGQQFISFADSRKGAAEPSLEQNLETERRWVISVILDRLHRFKFNDVYTHLLALINNASQKHDFAEMLRLNQENLNLLKANDNNDSETIHKIAVRNGMKNTIKWQTVLEELRNSNECKVLASCFAKDEDWDHANGCLSDDYLKKYVLGALYNTMKKRSKNGFSAESYGLFGTIYPKLETVTAIPQSVVNLNAELNCLSKPEITVEEWKNLLKLYVDFNVRTNENLFFRSTATGWDRLDINSCRNLTSTYGKRRSIKNPEIERGVHYKLLWRLFECDNEEQLNGINASLASKVEAVVKEMWSELKRISLIEQGMTYYQPYGCSNPRWFIDDLSDYEKNVEHRTNYRLNVSNISFELLDDAYCDNNVKAILDTTFLGNTPYQDDFKQGLSMPVRISPWEPPYPSLPDDLASYYRNNGTAFLFCKRISSIYSAEPIFIQHEHTAQVGRELTKSRIKDFKNHDINILACSTTMEMGIDIGELEIVSMSNVPPHPANYKQRAGRAGRAFQNKSACVTICNSDAVGLAVMEHPKEQLLEREVMTPSADLNSPQVVQRHINSYLLREYLVTNITGNHPLANRSIKSFAVLDFFFNDKYDVSDRSRKASWRNIIDRTNDSSKVYPNAYSTAFHEDSIYEKFLDWLLHLDHTNTNIWKDLDLLKSGTTLSGINNQELVNGTIRDLWELYACVQKKLEHMHNVACDPKLDLKWNAAPIKGHAARLNYDFVSLLLQNLLTYCSTHQFTPNANMPVNIVELRCQHDSSSYENPSRDLIVALSEYAPGAKVTIDGKSYTIAGVYWDRLKSSGSKSFRRIHVCRDCGYTWEDQTDCACPSCSGTRIRHNDMIEPTAFLPEQDTDRIIRKISSPVKIKANLIGADGLHFTPLTPLCEFDSENPNANTKILYLNEGAGFGYCVCTKFDCGRAEVETQLQQAGDTQYVRDLMYHKIEGNNGRPITYEHQNLNTYNQDTFDLTSIERNKFIGGSILTNFSILKPYHSSHSGIGRVPFTKHNAQEESILTTLGIIVCDELSKHLPCQRQDINFLITTINRGERALCIYDTAKGGAGYSSHLDSTNWVVMLGLCKDRLEWIVNGKKGIESILSRGTMRFIEDIDVMATYNWLMEEIAARTPIPNNIRNSYPNAVRSTLSDILNGINNANSVTVFVNSDIQSWNYELQNATVPSWKETRGSFRLNGTSKVELAFLGNLGVIPVEASDIIRHSEDWASFHVAAPAVNGVYPLAYVNGWLYLTDEYGSTNFNGHWANGHIYAVQTTKPLIAPIVPTLSQFTEFTINPGTKLASPKAIVDLLIQLDKSNQIRQFISLAKNHKIKFHYMDEHMKTSLGIVQILQFIQGFVDKIGCDSDSFSLVLTNEKFDLYTKGKSYTDRYRRVSDQLRTHADTNAIIDEYLYNTDWDYTISTQEENTLPHWRSLTIKDTDNGNTLIIKPHGGIANGWFIDTNETRRLNIFFNVNNIGIDSEIPLISDNNKPILYSVNLQ